MNFLVKVTETYEHTYLVEADNETQAQEIIEDNAEGCNVFDDYCGSTLSVRLPNKEEDLSLYDTCEGNHQFK